MRAVIMFCNTQRRTHFVVAFIFVVIAMSAESQAHITLPFGGGSNTIEFVEPIGQSFTADRTHYPRLGLGIGDVNASSAPTDFSIDFFLYEGAGTGGALLDSQAVTVPYAGFEGFVDADFDHIPLVIGNVYSLVVTQDNARWGHLTTLQSYAGGSGIFSGNAGFNDRSFRAVPEPSVAVLLAIGAALLAMRRWR